MLLAGVLFLYLLPRLIAGGGSFLDQQLGLQPFNFGAINSILGISMMIVGFYFGFWSIHAQLTRAQGTPLPMLPTQKLLTDGPFRFCRNPMTFGTIVAYTGIGVYARTISGIGIVLGFGMLLMLYLKLLEEKELAERFGEAYLKYKQEVPFIIPRLPKQH